MLHDIEDTIVAIASPPGAAFSGIVRVSGPGCFVVVNEVFRSGLKSIKSGIESPTCIPGKIYAGDLIGDVEAECYCWPDNQSYTRQPSIELHTVGSTPVLQAIERELVKRGGRMARPGEFTMRAFLAGRMDLSQAEAVIGVIDARDQSELQTALQQLAGGLTTPLQQMRESLLSLLANLEAGLDFVEEDIEFISTEQVTNHLSDIRASIDQLIKQVRSRSLAADIPRAILVGKPNAGKSSLFNAIVGSDNAIVSDVSGTTRDYLSATIEHNTFTFNLLDSAGVDEATQLEQAAAELPTSIDDQATSQTSEQRSRAQLVVHCFDCSVAQQPDGTTDIPASDFQAAIRVATKCDLQQRQPKCDENYILTSSNTGQGIDELKDRIVEKLVEQSRDKHSTSVASRCLESLENALGAINLALESVATGLGDEITAIEVRDALNCLGQIIGVVYTDDILDRIFSQFCIGK